MVRRIQETNWSHSFTINRWNWMIFHFESSRIAQYIVHCYQFIIEMKHFTEYFRFDFNFFRWFIVKRGLIRRSNPFNLNIRYLNISESTHSILTTVNSISSSHTPSSIFTNSIPYFWEGEKKDDMRMQRERKRCQKIVLYVPHGTKARWEDCSNLKN